MNSERVNNGGARSLAVVLHEIKDDLKEFLQTRYDLLRSELSEKLAVWKTSLPMIVGALMLAWSGFLALTFTFIALLRPLFASEYAWAIAAGIVAAVYFLVAGVIAWLAYRELTYTGVAPTRTMQVLKQDQVWLQNEARQQP
ncbi:MAG TPA: phage holin family protein [Terriglobales bacterium]|nr:phage holin family protein [Terriglobales bacterium]